MACGTSAVRCALPGLERVGFERKGFIPCSAATVFSRCSHGSRSRCSEAQCFSGGRSRCHSASGTFPPDPTSKPSLRGCPRTGCDTFCSSAAGVQQSVWPLASHRHSPGCLLPVETHHGASAGEWWQRHSRLFYSDSRGQVTAMLNLKDPVDLLNFFVANESGSVGLLVSCLGRLVRVCPSATERQALIADERFHRLVDTLALRLEDCEARQLAELGVYISQLCAQVPAVQEVRASRHGSWGRRGSACCFPCPSTCNAGPCPGSYRHAIQQAASLPVTGYSAVQLAPVCSSGRHMSGGGPRRFLGCGSPVCRSLILVRKYQFSLRPSLFACF